MMDLTRRWKSSKLRGTLIFLSSIAIWKEDGLGVANGDYEWFKEGSNNSDMKQGPAMMAQRLRDLFPGLYTLPEFTEIQSYISRVFTKEKKGTNASPVTSDDDDDDDEEEEDDVLDGEQRAVIEAALAVVDKYAGVIQPQYVLVHLKMHHGEEILQHKEATKRAITKRKAKWAKQNKQLLIG